MPAQSAVNSDPTPSSAVAPFDLEAISTLTDDQIHHSMTPEELIAVIRCVDYPFAGKDRLEYFDRDTLERVVCLIRRWSCHRLGKLSL
ncbi:MAG TPA: hypothetical protein VMR25_16750 [Planctomycetaceae bacterium]|jgi:hypothetical protein|nr:hypothetical protein [Planctomycetaceae bacterium]